MAYRCESAAVRCTSPIRVDERKREKVYIVFVCNVIVYIKKQSVSEEYNGSLF